MSRFNDIFKNVGHGENGGNPLEFEIDAISDLCMLIVDSDEKSGQRRLYENCLHAQEEEIARKMVAMDGVDKEFLEELILEIKAESMFLMVLIGNSIPSGLMIYESIERALEKAKSYLDGDGN